jgi:hypothetical protein
MGIFDGFTQTLGDFRLPLSREHRLHGLLDRILRGGDSAEASSQCIARAHDFDVHDIERIKTGSDLTRDEFESQTAFASRRLRRWSDICSNTFRSDAQIVVWRKVYSFEKRSFEMNLAIILSTQKEAPVSLIDQRAGKDSVLYDWRILMPSAKRAEQFAKQFDLDSRQAKGGGCIRFASAQVAFNILDADFSDPGYPAINGSIHAVLWKESRVADIRSLVLGTGFRLSDEEDS